MAPWSSKPGNSPEFPDGIVFYRLRLAFEHETAHMEDYAGHQTIATETVPDPRPPLEALAQPDC